MAMMVKRANPNAQEAVIQPKEGRVVSKAYSCLRLNLASVGGSNVTVHQLGGYLGRKGLKLSGRTGDHTCVYFDDPDGHRLHLLYKGHD